MDKEQIEKEAKQAIHEYYNCNGKYPCINKDYCMYHNGHNTSYDCDECGADNFYEGFIKGADWRINSVWHDVSDEPDLKKLLLVEDIDGAYNLTYMTKIKKWEGFVQYEHYTRWAYVEDLLPDRKEDAE